MTGCSGAGESLPRVSVLTGGKRPAPVDLLPQMCSHFARTLKKPRKRLRLQCPRTQSVDVLSYSQVNDGAISCYQQDKDCRTLVFGVSSSLRSLWELDSVADFESCYIDIVEMHFRAYEHGVFHQDISDEIAMVHKSEGVACGCLVDWDLAFSSEHQVERETTDPSIRRGTSPFLAIDLQSVTLNGRLLPLSHRYCHDLEALFWLLLWAVIHFDIPNNRRLPCRVPKWGKSATADVATFKHCVLTAVNTRQGVLELALPIHEDIVERWVVPLAAMFKKARSDAEDINERKRCFFNVELYAKGATFEKFMETIRRRP